MLEGRVMEASSLDQASEAAPLCELRDIRKEYRLRRGLIERFSRAERRVAAVDGVSLSIPRGQIFGLVGESGCGKSTLAQIMVHLIAPTSGQLLYRNADVAGLSAAEWREFRHGVQMVFQDTNSSLNPRKRIRRVLSEALYARNTNGAMKGAAAVQAEMARLMDQVGLDTSLLGRFPHELSGGQRQRIGVARALAMSPELLVADEPVSSLDVSMQGQIVNLLQELNQRLGLTIVLISHDLAIVARICTRIAVMKAGKIVEIGPARQLLTTPSHPYTRTLLNSIPRGLKGRTRTHTAVDSTETLGHSERHVSATQRDDVVKLSV
jgi:peptide/nickel transport system ATP-binding protein